MKKRTAKPKKAPKQDQAWFERKVSELGARLNKLPAARQDQLEQDLRKDHAITPNLRKRLEELFADSPLNDEPLTPEQEEAVDRLMGRRPKASRPLN